MLLVQQLAARTDAFTGMGVGLPSLQTGGGPSGPAAFCQGLMDAPGGTTYFAGFNSTGAGYPEGTQPMEQCIAEVRPPLPHLGRAERRPAEGGFIRAQGLGSRGLHRTPYPAAWGVHFVGFDK